MIRNRRDRLTSPLAMVLAIGACALVTACAGAPPDARDDLVAAAIAPRQDLWTRMLAAEDARGRGPAGIAPLVEGLASDVAELRAIAARGLGRLERPELVDTIGPALQDPDAVVRAEAANALGQVAPRGDAEAARGMLTAALATERDPRVRGVIGQTLGRLVLPAGGWGGRAAGRAGRSAPASGGGTAEAGGESRTPAPAADPLATPGLLADLAAESDPATRLGAAKGFYFLARQPAGSVIVALHADALRALVTPDGAPGSDSTVAAARTRRIAAAALAASGTASTSDLRTWLNDVDPYVRREAILAALRVARGNAGVLLAQGLADVSGAVRYDALRIVGRADGASCDAPMRALHDASPGVRLLAVDLLGSCEPAGPAVAALDSIAATLESSGTEWHAPAHALVALAGRARDRARVRLPSFAGHANGFVRMYAARVASLLEDVATLHALAVDAEPNVRTEIVRGLSRLNGHVSDEIYLAQLRPRPDAPLRRLEPDPQLAMAAAAALDGSPHPGAAAALLDALDVLTADSAETSRDARVALIERAAQLGDASYEARMRSYLADFDPSVAEAAAEALQAWTGQRPEPAPRPLPPEPLPSFETLATLERDRFVITLADGGEIVVALDAFAAPTNAARFARLAESGAFDGLTYHRVVPNFVVQGGSPAANEYSGQPSFSRDELGIDGNWRGTIGLSTRGRDTGDAQMYINLIDNIRLDHEYTTYGRIVDGMDVVDRLVEGAVIRSVRRTETGACREP